MEVSDVILKLFYFIFKIWFIYTGMENYSFHQFFSHFRGFNTHYIFSVWLPLQLCQGSRIITCQIAHQSPFLPPCKLCEQEVLGNAAQWGHTLGIPALQLCCPVLQHSCARVCQLLERWCVLWRYQLSSLIFSSRARHQKCCYKILQQSSTMRNNVVKNNGNKDPQSHMVMRLYFRAVAASV